MIDVFLNFWVAGLICFGLIGVAYIKYKRFQDAADVFKATILSFFGNRGKYASLDEFLEQYCEELGGTFGSGSRGVHRSWVEFVQSVRIARTQKGNKRFESSEKAIGKLESDWLRVSSRLPGLHSFGYYQFICFGVICMCIAAIFGTFKIYFNLKAGQSLWLDMMPIISFGVFSFSASVGSGLFLQTIERQYQKRLSDQIKVVMSHLNRYLMFRSDTDFLYQVERSIKKELESFKRVTVDLNSKVTDLKKDIHNKDTKVDAEIISQDIKSELKKSFVELKSELHAGSEKQMQRQQQHESQVSNMLASWKTEFHDMSDSVQSLSKMIETLGVKYADHPDQGQFDDKLGNLRYEQEKLRELTLNYLGEIKQDLVDIKQSDRNQQAPVAEVIQFQPKVEEIEETPDLQEGDFGISPKMHEMFHLLMQVFQKVETNLCVAYEQAGYFTKSLRSAKGELLHLSESFEGKNENITKIFEQSIVQIDEWETFLEDVKLVKGRLVTLAHDDLSDLLAHAEVRPYSAQLESMWTEAEFLDEFLAESEMLVEKVGIIIRSFFRLQENYLKVREGILFLSTVDDEDLAGDGVELAEEILKSLKRFNRHKTKLEFSTVSYAKEFLPPVRKLQKLITLSREQLGGVNAEDVGMQDVSEAS